MAGEPLTAAQVFALAGYARHRPYCPEANGPADCNCGLYALLDTIRCGTCGHKVNWHTNRDVSDVVGWPCSECRSARCKGFALAAPSDAPEEDR